MSKEQYILPNKCYKTEEKSCETCGKTARYYYMDEGIQTIHRCKNIRERK